MKSASKVFSKLFACAVVLSAGHVYAAPPSSSVPITPTQILTASLDVTAVTSFTLSSNAITFSTLPASATALNADVWNIVNTTLTSVLAGSAEYGQNVTASWSTHGPGSSSAQLVGTNNSANVVPITWYYGAVGSTLSNTGKPITNNAKIITVSNAPNDSQQADLGAKIAAGTVLSTPDYYTGTLVLTQGSGA